MIHQIPVPLKTFQGLVPSELRAIIGNKTIVIWSTGHLGRSLKRSFEKCGFKVSAFCDSNPIAQKRPFEGLEVLDPKVAIERSKNNQTFIIIASARYRTEIETQCKLEGLVNKVHYLSYLLVSRPEAAVDIAGATQFKALMKGPLGNMADAKPSGLIEINNYHTVLNKLLNEIPHLINVEIATWGEPLFHPQLAEIIQSTEQHVSCTVVTTLQVSSGIEALAKGNPSQIIIHVAGYEESYEINHSGASWNSFVTNLKRFKELMQKHNTQSQVSIAYQLYQNNQNDDVKKMHALSSELDFKFYTGWSYINPYDRLLNYVEAPDFQSTIQTEIDFLPWKLDEVLLASKNEKMKPCLCQRIFPFINWDLSVSLCHIYSRPVIAENFLDINIDELLKLRHDQEQCARCQSFGLHRLDIEVLLRTNPKDIILKNPEGH